MSNNIGLYLGIGLVFLVMIYIISTYNRIKRLSNEVKETSSGIDVALSKRFSLIPNLVEVVKAAMHHEKKTLELVTEKRSEAISRKAFDDQTGEVVTQLLALSEKYPSLKTDQQFLHLQAALVDVEEHLQASRRLYNRKVSMLNTLIVSFPASLINGLAGEKEAAFYEAEPAARDAVHVSFDIKDI